jgi:hypothetical protein
MVISVRVDGLLELNGALESAAVTVPSGGNRLDGLKYFLPLVR